MVENMNPYNRKFVIWETILMILCYGLGLGMGYVIWGDTPLELDLPYYNFNDLVIGIVKPIAIPVKTITAEVTAYTPTIEECGLDPETMASGRKIYTGAIACPREIPFGTVVKIDENWFVCEDRLAEKYDNRFDILMFNKEEALEWGKRTKQITLYL